MVRQLRPIVRNDTEAPELWGSIQEQLPQCMRDSVASFSRDSSAPIGRKRAADDVLPGPPQKRPALEGVGCPVIIRGSSTFPQHLRQPHGHAGCLGHHGRQEQAPSDVVSAA